MTYPSFVKDKNDFNHVIRIFNTNLPGSRTVLYSLTGIKGVGRRFGDAVIKRSGIDGTKRMGELTAEEIEKLVQVWPPTQFSPALSLCCEAYFFSLTAGD
jgi:small subunit ribosomal protein S18e